MRTPGQMIAGGVVAGLAAVAVMYVAAGLAGTRPLPDVVSEPLLAAMPGPVFGFLIDRLQHVGKVVEEGGLVLAMVLLLAGLGSGAAWLQGRSRFPRPALAAAAVAWLAVVLMVLPAAGEGLLGLREGPVTPLVWALVFAVYAAVLQWPAPAARQPAADPGRRRLLAAVPAVIGLAGLGVIAYRLVPGWMAAATSRAAAGTLTEDITPPGDFYLVSKNFSDPAVDAGRWWLNVRGLAGSPYRLSHAELKALPEARVLATVECISNNVGGNQVSTGEFAGPRLGDLVQRASPSPRARFVNFRSADGYSESLPIDLALSEPEIIVAHSLGGLDLAPGHGFPARLLVPGRYGMKGPKWLTEVELAATDGGGYWEGQGWDHAAVARTMSRIDTPKEGAILRSGPVLAGGIAYAGRRGIARVEVSTDGGRSWVDAALRPARGPLTWVIWTFEWRPGPGEHTLAVRATDGSGTPQDAETAPSFPRGSSGYHRVRVSVARAG